MDILENRYKFQDTSYKLQIEKHFQLKDAASRWQEVYFFRIAALYLVSCTLYLVSAVIVIGILGGTFDPIHYGHLRPAQQVLHNVGLDEVRLVPTAIPPHRAEPVASTEHRLRMVTLAAAEYQGLRMDDRETRVEGPSYTVRTLHSLRAEFMAQPLCLLMGADAFNGLESWHHWEELLELAHIVVMQRPGWPMPGVSAELPVWATGRVCSDSAALSRQSTGCILFQRVAPQDISASRIRDMIARGESAKGLMPDSVWDYIRSYQLYGYKS